MHTKQGNKRDYRKANAKEWNIQKCITRVRNDSLEYDEKEKRSAKKHYNRDISINKLSRITIFAYRAQISRFYSEKIVFPQFTNPQTLKVSWIFFRN